MATTYKSPTYTAPKYNSPVYDEKKYRQGVDTAYYTKAINNYTKQANQARQTQIGEAQKQQNAALKQAYITRAQNEKAVNDRLAAAGIRGGATETANLRIGNQYSNDTATANANYQNTVNAINQQYNQNIADYRSDMESRAEQYRQNMAQAKWTAAREDAANKWNAEREDAAKRWQAQREDVIKQWEAGRQDAQTERNSAIEYWSNYYADYYSGADKKDLKKALKKARANLKTAKTATEKIRIQQQIRGIKTRQGVLANKK